jgi:hypothetical protein
VQRWVDYSQKYGIGYMNSDQTCGVYFNDGSKLISDRTEQMFDIYIKEKDASGQKQEKKLTFTFDYFPEEYQKKVDLFRNFVAYLKKDGSKS